MSESSNKNDLDDNAKTSPYKQYLQSCKDLRNAPNDLWLIYLIKFFNFHSFSALISSIVIYLDSVKDVSDSSLGLVFLIVLLSAVTWVILLGNFPDRYGVRITLIIGNILAVLKMSLLAFYSNLYFQVAVLMLLGSSSAAITNPALEASVKHYTHINYRTLAASFFMSIQYLSFVLTGVSIEILLTVGNKDEESFRIFFIYLAAVALVAAILSFFVRNTDYEYLSDHPSEPKSIIKESGWEHTRQVLVLKNFWRFFTVMIMIVLIRIIFYQQLIILPLYMDRDLGNDEHYGITIIANQVVIIILLPLFSYTQYYMKPYTAFIIVGFFAVASTVIFVLGASYFTIFTYVVVSSIGEGLFSARILEYVYEVAPKGKESVVLAISYLPMIFGAILAAIIGGVLMEGFCPEDGERSCWKVWGIITLVAVPGVLVLIFCRTCLEHKKFEEQPYMPCSLEAKHD